MAIDVVMTPAEIAHAERLKIHNDRQKARKEARRNKICINCQIPYFDSTKRIVGKTCSKSCAMKIGVNKRKSKGSYIRTEKQNQRLSDSIRKIVEASGKIFKIRGKKREWYLQKHGVSHWSQTPEGRKRISEIHSGKKQPPGHQRRMVEASLKSQNVHSRSKKGIREDLGCFFRSTWEANYARYLNSIGTKWKYESVTYQLGENKTYTPDFILEDGSHVEIKGWLMAKGAEKIRLFKEQYPQISLQIIGRPEYNALKKQYQFLIENWEKS